MNPGATTWWRASITSRAAAPPSLPMALTRPSVTATSPANAGWPEPSTTRPFSITRSCVIGVLLGRERARRSWSRSLEAVELGHVVVEHEVALLVRQVRGVLRQHGLRVRPRRVAVREVVRPHQPPDVAEVLHLEGHPVVLERGVDMLAEVLARQSDERPTLEPVAVALPRVVHAVHEVRHPACVGLDAHQPEPRMALEHSAEYERPDDVLAAADDRHEGVDPGPPHPEAVLLT